MRTKLMHILIVEDNRDIAANVGESLESSGYTLDYAYDGITGLHLAVVNHYDAIILDLTLPGMDGLQVSRKLRNEAGKDTPILMLTARDTVAHKLEGFSVGGDDYLIKPFSLLELEARLLALHRRATSRNIRRILTVHDLVFDTETLTIRRADQLVSLGPTARSILALLMNASPRVVTRTEIERQIWGDDPPDNDAMRAHIHLLRNAIDRPYTVKLLHTIHGAGYRLGLGNAP